MIRIQLQFIKTNITQCALLFFICIFSISSIKAQESVYYLVNHHASDMFRVNTNTNIVEEIISFKDEVVIQNEAIQENIKTYLQEILNTHWF